MYYDYPKKAKDFMLWAGQTVAMQLLNHKQYPMYVDLSCLGSPLSAAERQEIEDQFLSCGFSFVRERSKYFVVMHGQASHTGADCSHIQLPNFTRENYLKALELWKKTQLERLCDMASERSIQSLRYGERYRIDFEVTCWHKILVDELNELLKQKTRTFQYRGRPHYVSVRFSEPEEKTVTNQDGGLLIASLLPVEE